VAAEPRREGLWTWLLPSPRMAFAVAALLVLGVWLTSMPPARQPASNTTASTQSRGSEAEFTVIENLPVLEDYDVLSNFDALSELPVEPAVPAQRPM